MYWIRNPQPDNIPVLRLPNFLSEQSLTELKSYVDSHELQEGGVVSASERISADQVRKSRIIWVKAERQRFPPVQ